MTGVTRQMWWATRSQSDVPPASVVVAAAARLRSCVKRRENDPARGMLTRFYGSEWTEAAIEGILFDFKGDIPSEG